MQQQPTVTLVFLVYNRREELRESLHQMLEVSDYPRDLVDVIVVDNASTDGVADMVREEFPQVQLIRREENIGVSGWNDGFAVARGDYVAALDDDCYLPADGLTRARRRAAGARRRPHLVLRRRLRGPQLALQREVPDRAAELLGLRACSCAARCSTRLKGYDPEIFVWANELEFMVRFFDAGFRHLHAAGDRRGAHEGGGRGRLARLHALEGVPHQRRALRLHRRQAAAHPRLGRGVRRDRLRHPARRRSHRQGHPEGPRARGAAAMSTACATAPRLRTRRVSAHLPAQLPQLRQPVVALADGARAAARAARRARRRACLRRDQPETLHLARRDQYWEERARYYPTAAATLEM